MSARSEKVIKEIEKDVSMMYAAGIIEPEEIVAGTIWTLDQVYDALKSLGFHKPTTTIHGKNIETVNELVSGYEKGVPVADLVNLAGSYSTLYKILKSQGAVSRHKKGVVPLKENMKTALDMYFFEETFWEIQQATRVYQSNLCMKLRQMGLKTRTEYAKEGKNGLEEYKKWIKENLTS